MSDPAAQSRRIRQLLAIDQFLGADSVPLGTPPLIDTPEAEPASAGRAPSRRFAPARTPPAASPKPPAPGRTFNEPTAGGSLIPSLQDHAMIASNTMSRDEKTAALDQLKEEITAFVTNEWPHEGWNNVVFGEGDVDADLMFVGEAPGADEDRTGRPFVGRAGKLLDKQIEAMGLARTDVFIANIGKVRPPGNRVPTPDEADRMMPFLLKQIEIICPKVIVSLGATSAKYLLNSPKLAITRERGRWRDFHGIDLMPTFHPAYLLRQYTKENRARVWQDLQNVMQRLGLPIPKK